MKITVAMQKRMKKTRRLFNENKSRKESKQRDECGFYVEKHKQQKTASEILQF